MPDRMLKWSVDSVNSQAEVQSIYLLRGATSSSVHNISLKIDQITKNFVLRQFDNEKWLQEEPDIADHEAASLRWVADELGLPTPQLVAYDTTGSKSGMPAVLMTKLEGEVVLIPESIDAWLNGMAVALGLIHTVNVEGFPYTYFSYNDILTLRTPEWSSAPKIWNQALAIVKGPQPDVKECFIHRDYHPANLLWLDHQVSGVVDWVNACRGPAGIDVGHCRVNLAMLHGVSVADKFLDAYQDCMGATFNYHPYWDFISLFDILSGPPEVYSGWQAFGVTGLTNGLMEERLDRYLLSLLERI